MRFRTLALVAASLLLAGCSGLLREAPGITYSKHVAQLGINPVYPPSEDIQVGDIYAFESSADRLQARRAFLGWVDVRKEVQSYLAGRMKFGSTTLVAGTGDPALARAQIDTLDGRPLPTYSNLSTLPIASFPAIEVDSGLSVGLRGTPSGIAAIFGFAAERTLKMRLEFRGVSSYEIPIPQGLAALYESCTYNSDYCRSATLANWIDQKYQLSDSHTRRVKSAYPLIVTKVYLARQINYSFDDATLAALAVAEINQKGEIAPAPPTITTDALTELLGRGDADAINATRELINDLNANLREKGAAEGSSFSFAMVNASTVEIRQIFERPVVIAYEGGSFDGNWPPTEVE